ncbi:helix-turn-helix domain-containing protein [Parasphingorhabdus sp.]|uniref:helix-turn-helix domain-containing protein n=1 Tax=Parasphingorhabdus sp. TaxID=2709688 RepID=UPI0032633C0E
MSGKRVNYRLVKLHRNYNVDDISRLLGVHKNTVREWIKRGLPVIDDDRKPKLVLGSDLKSWLENNRKSAKQPCGPNQLYCLKCRMPKRPALGMVDYLPKNEQSGCLKALCETCERPINRNARLAVLTHIMPEMEIQFAECQSRLSGRAELPPNSDLKRD